MKTRGVLLAAALLCSAQASALETAKPSVDAKAARIDRMTDLLVQAMPMGTIFETVMKGDPAWPVQANPGALDATQLACLRGELSPEGVRRNKRAEVAAYIASHPKQVDDEIVLMGGGAAELMNKFTLAGAKGESSTGRPDVNAIISGATPEQALSFVRFVTAPEYTELRKLAGIGDVFDPASSAEQNEKSGERLGASLGATAMLKAVGVCRIPMSALLDPENKDS
jgi:hypothetical protein